MNDKVVAYPFLKWAGGKTQLIKSIEQALPEYIKTSSFTYVEPFIGSGAVMFWMLNRFPNIKNVVINDVNSDLINTYKIISKQPYDLIELLQQYQSEYHAIEDDLQLKQHYYYSKRDLYNSRQSDHLTHAALFIYLNRTCFNGLYRVNKSNYFNVPIGSYKKPTICDAKNIIAVHSALQKVIILDGDYSQTLNYASEKSFFYFDPPYKPLNNTSSFNSYAHETFDDREQIRLRDFCATINARGAMWMLSNSDVKAKNQADNFFDDLFNKYHIKRIKAKRIINANPSKRGELNELLITNYQYEQALSIA